MKSKKIILVLGFSVFFMFSTFAANFTAQVTEVSGKAEVLQGTEWKSLKIGDVLKNGDTIQTGFKSSLVLKVKDSIVNVSALTRMTVEQLSENPQKDNVRVFVKTGSISSDVKKSENKKLGFTVRTPVATASVRGTEFSVTNNFDSVGVNTTRGSVAVWNENNSESVEQNSSGQDDADNSQSNDDGSKDYENAPHGSIFVNQNQGTSVSSNGNVSSQQKNASSNANLSGSTKTLADSEKTNSNVPTVNTKDSKARLVIIPKIEE